MAGICLARMYMLSSDVAPWEWPEPRITNRSLRLHWRENVPKPEGFVASSCYYCLPIRWHCKVKHTQCMSSQSCDLWHWWILPHHYLVLGIPMGAHKLIYIFTPGKIADLAACVNWIQHIPISCIPELDASISRSTSWCHEAMLVWWPGYGFNRSGMFCQPQHRLLRPLVPYKKLVVISTRCKLTVIMRPFQSTDLWSVARKFADVVIGDTDIMLQYALVPATRGQDGWVPR